MSTTDVPREVVERTVWVAEDGLAVVVIDQRELPFRLTTRTLASVHEMAEAISTMVVRGAGCIGVAAGYGMYLATIEAETLPPASGDTFMQQAADLLVSTRPTAANLEWAVRRQQRALEATTDGPDRIRIARQVADTIAAEDVAACRQIGIHGLEILRTLQRAKGGPINVLTHCNAGWLAFVEHGSATAPIYAAHDAGVPVHVYVGETRPLNQGRLTAWELDRAGVDHTFVVDNAVGHLIRRGKVDVVIVGADRVSRQGDTANKIGTYLRALVAHHNDVPFYVALPSSTFDFAMLDGEAEIPIEERSSEEVTHVRGITPDGPQSLRIVAEGTDVRNPAFDVTPAELITGLITERGLCEPTEEAITALFPEPRPGR